MAGVEPPSPARYLLGSLVMLLGLVCAPSTLTGMQTYWHVSNQEELACTGC